MGADLVRLGGEQEHDHVDVALLSEFVADLGDLLLFTALDASSQEQFALTFLALCPLAVCTAFGTLTSMNR